MSPCLPVCLCLLLAAAAALPSGVPALETGLEIIGGDTADIKSVPYQVSIELKKAHHCGGSVLSNKWILTAAHCVYGHPVSSLGVRAGTDKLQMGGSLVAVRAASVHPKYVHGIYDSDVAVLELASALSLGATIKPVVLPPSGKEPQTNIPVVVSGWGLTTPQKRMLWRHRSAASPAALLGPNLPTQLRKVTVRVVSRTTCHSSYNAVLTSRMICAAAPGKDACTYDSGGPLVDGSGVQVGIVSFGHGCAQAQYPGVYTHVGSPDVRSFIKSKTHL
ncbi:trypsin beta-like [Thrips palmi]|uniref:Trypsin beta-like n=1 Tax=Thrips palmi TaxID=161013 RepID=A0A6P8YVU9_THRPL|nr:trypsin beta-like [Thrips palmi]